MKTGVSEPLLYREEENGSEKMEKWKKILKTAALGIWILVIAAGITWITEIHFYEKAGQGTENRKGHKTEQNGNGTGAERLQTFSDRTKETYRKEKEEKHAYLTFDDGPSDRTDQILDILKENGVRATFFVVGKTDARSVERYKRIVEEGHSLGMHSYTHDYSYIYGSMEHYIEDLEKLQNYLYKITGEKVKLYRFPGGSSNSVSEIPISDCIRYLNKQNIVYFDWNASSEDALTRDASAKELNRAILKDALLYKNTVILMHDLHECRETVKGLPALIRRLKKEGYILQGITEDTPPVQHIKNRK